MRISDWSSDVCSSDLRIAELKIDRGGQPARAAHVADGGGGGEIEPHRLLQQHRRALGQRREDIDMRHWWGGDIERRVGGSGLFERVEHRIDAPFARQCFGPPAIMTLPRTGRTEGRGKGCQYV